MILVIIRCELVMRKRIPQKLIYQRLWASGQLHTSQIPKKRFLMAISLKPAVKRAASCDTI